MTSRSDAALPSDPHGTLLVRTLTMPADANLNGGIFGGWILAEMDKAAGVMGMRRAGGACTTVAVENVSFLSPLEIGEDFTIYGTVTGTGRTSMRLSLEGWAASPRGTEGARKIVQGLFVSVALDDTGRPRPLPPNASNA